MSSDPAIRVHDLSKCYQIYSQPSHRLMQMIFRGKKKFFQEFWALNAISFEIAPGETVGIIGRNGSGKSTLLQILCGTLNATGGQTKVNGRVAALLELGSGFNPEFTGRENVYMNATIYGLNQKQIDSRFDDIARFADIGDFIDQPVKSYSSGMFVRLAFAVIAHVDADILVIDEALAVGDVFFVQKCMRFLRNFSKKGTLLFVSHDTHAVVNLCDKAILLENGLIKRIGHPKNVSEHYLAMLHNNDAHEEPVDSKKDTMALKGNHDQALPPDNDEYIVEINDENENDFGTGLARIIGTKLVDRSGTPPVSVIGGEAVKLVIRCMVEEDIPRPIVGFLIKDRLGQVIFGDNTHTTYANRSITISAATLFDASFEFNIPILQYGDYSISLAVGQGDQENHIHHHWVHDALILHCRPDVVCSGVFKVPMHKVSFDFLKPERTE